MNRIPKPLKGVCVSTRHAFEPSTRLLDRQKVAREVLLADGQNIDRPLLEEQPDYGERRPIDWEQLPV